MRPSLSPAKGTSPVRSAAELGCAQPDALDDAEHVLIDLERDALAILARQVVDPFHRHNLSVQSAPDRLQIDRDAIAGGGWWRLAGRTRSIGRQGRLARLPESRQWWGRWGRKGPRTALALSSA